jgi:chromosome segregation ATPase
MAPLKRTARKSTGPKGVPRHQLASRGDGASSNNRKSKLKAENERLTNELLEVSRGRCLDVIQIGKLESQNEGLQRQLQYHTMMHQSCEHTLRDAIEQRTEAWNRVDHANWHIHELGSYVRNLEEYVTELDGENRRLRNLTHQPAAAAEDPEPVVPANDDGDHDDVDTDDGV